MARRALMLLLTLALLWPTAVHAQEVTFTPGPPAPSGPSAGDIKDAVLSGLGGAMMDAFNSWWANSGPGAIGRLVALAFGAVAEAIWLLAGGALGHTTNLFTQLPPTYTYNLAPVAALRAQLLPVARALLGLAVVLGVVSAGAGFLWGWPVHRLVTQTLPAIGLATAGLLAGPDLLRWWIDLCNAASAALLSPSAGLPGLEALHGVDHVSALGVVALLYLVFAVWLLLQRLKLLVLAALLLTIAPLACAVGALPFPLAQRFFRWWLSTFVGVTAVQVLQAVCLGLGAGLLAAAVTSAPASASDPNAGMLTAAMGAGALLAAITLPGLLLGTLARTATTGALANTAMTAAGVATGILGAFAAQRLYAQATQVRGWTPPLGGPVGARVTVLPRGEIGSLLGGGRGPKLLPPPAS